ncbi:MAG: hypothetical protein HGA85_05485 [Nanoarchaeota archaeon]|nr:hypothetical protein [Nanoarchaeota archaeon]
MDLISWCSNYIDYRNAFQHDLIEKRQEGNMITCMYKVKGQVIYLIEEALEESVFDKMPEGAVYIVCLNTKANISFLTSHWEGFIKNQKLVILFSNPIVNMHWPLMPYRHNLVIEPGSLKNGLKSLAESVPLI